MGQPDNHIDEIVGTFIALKFDVDVDDFSDGTLERWQSMKQKLDQYYADFYRNKIPEKIKKVPYSETQKKLLHYAGGYNQAIDDITTQFNSKGDSDEN